MASALKRARTRSEEVSDGEAETDVYDRALDLTTSTGLAMAGMLGPSNADDEFGWLVLGVVVW